MPDYVTVTIDGKDIPIKDFVQAIIGEGIEGMVKTLRMIPENYSEINITIQPANKSEN